MISFRSNRDLPMNLLMSAFLVESVKVLVTKITFKGTLNVVRLSVFRQIGRFAKRLATNLAL